MTHPDIITAERFGLPEAEPEIVDCPSCDSEVRQEQLDRCAICQERGCTRCLHEIDTGERVCENCKAIAISPLQVAAKRAARTGSRRDLQAYLKLRRETA